MNTGFEEFFSTDSLTPAYDICPQSRTGQQAICEEAALSEVGQALFWWRQFLNPFAFINAPNGVNVPLPG